MTEIDVELLRKLITYDPVSGITLWKRREPWMFVGKWPDRACASWNTRYAGKEVGCFDKDGYQVASALGVYFKVHRAVWALMTGKWPLGEVDHQDTDTGNNRWLNLRDSSRSANSANRAAPSNNTSGLKRVSWSKTMSQWESRIQVDGKNHLLGYYDCPAAASFAYQIAADKHFGEFARFA